MSHEELDRLQIMTRIAGRQLSQRRAAELLGLTERQVRRLYGAFKAHGAAGLVSAKRGKPSNRRLPQEIRCCALELIRALRRLRADPGASGDTQNRPLMDT